MCAGTVDHTAGDAVDAARRAARSWRIPTVRKAILGLLDVELLAAVGSRRRQFDHPGSGYGARPSDPGYVATAPPPLGEAGTAAVHRGRLSGRPQRCRIDSAVGRASQVDSSRADPRTHQPGNGQTLSLAIGVAANDPTSVAVAGTAADQLRSVGISATVLPLEPQVLYGTALATNRIPTPSSAGMPPAVTWPPFWRPATAVRRWWPPVATAPARPPKADAPASTSPSVPPDAAPLVRAPSNLTGICDRSVQPPDRRGAGRRRNINDVINAVEPKLWAMSSVLPIMQDTTIVAAGPSVQNVSLTGAVPIGIVGDAARWVKTSS